jgi:23S rRNA G2069 N7-methylase RlmK/C1962 C5-methylase RlmI
VRDDVATFLRAALEAGQGWDIVILDPPKLAPNRCVHCAGNTQQFTVNTE